MNSGEAREYLDKNIKKFGMASIPENVFNELKRENPEFPFVCTDKWLIMLKKEKSKCDVLVLATAMKVMTRLKNIENNEQVIRCSIFDGQGLTEVVMSREVLSKQGLRELRKYGADYPEKFADRIIEYLANSSIQAKMAEYYSTLGWNANSWDYFKANHVYFSNEKQHSEAQYNGSLDIRPNGDLDVWRNMVRTLVLPNIPLSVVLLIGFASPLLNILSAANDLGSLIFNLSNRTSKGKTTAAMLAISVFSNPKIGAGTITNFNSTANAMREFLMTTNGFPVAIDEVAMHEIKNFESFLYQLASGTEKQRLTSECVLRAKREAIQTILTTAEYDLLDENDPEGLRARIFELKDDLTCSAESADAIKQTVLNNYAVAADPFLRFMMSRGKDKIYSDYIDCKEVLVNKVKVLRPLSTRIMSKFAVLLLAERYAKEALKLRFDEESIIDYLIQMQNAIVNMKTPDEQMLEAIRQEIVSNACHYNINNNTPSSTFGKITCTSRGTEVAILKHHAEEIFHTYALHGIKGALQTLREKELLLCEDPNRLTKRVTVVANHQKATCYVFLLKTDEMNVASSETESQEQEQENITDIENDIIF